jgi:ABC-type transport system involved in cytochrome c biogenesis permease component
MSPLRIIAQWVAVALVGSLFISIQGLLLLDYSVNQVLFIAACGIGASLVGGVVCALIFGNRSRQ